MVHVGDVFLIPVSWDSYALASVQQLGVAPWAHDIPVMLIAAFDGVVTEAPDTVLPAPTEHQWWCVRSFVEDGSWLLIRQCHASEPEQPSATCNVWVTHELFLDDLRQRLGLERRTYRGAEFTFAKQCTACGEPMDIGFARCPTCSAVREEFRGLEHFVSAEVGFCSASGARTDVRAGEDGSYLWAPYFIDRIRAGGGK